MAWAIATTETESPSKLKSLLNYQIVSIDETAFLSPEFFGGFRRFQGQQACVTSPSLR
jgi:hypothetical protein